MKIIPPLDLDLKGALSVLRASFQRKGKKPKKAKAPSDAEAPSSSKAPSKAKTLTPTFSEDTASCQAALLHNNPPSQSSTHPDKDYRPLGPISDSDQCDYLHRIYRTTMQTVMQVQRIDPNPIPRDFDATGKKIGVIRAANAFCTLAAGNHFTVASCIRLDPKEVEVFVTSETDLTVDLTPNIRIATNQTNRLPILVALEEDPTLCLNGDDAQFREWLHSVNVEKNQHLPRHLSNLKVLLNSDDRKEGGNNEEYTYRLHAYAAVSCGSRMRRRFDSALSIAFMSAIKDFDSASLTESEIEELIKPAICLELELQEKAADNVFLEFVVQPLLQYKSAIDVSSLLKLLQEQQEGHSVEIYSKETFHHFHQLLVVFLSMLETAVADLSTGRKKLEGAEFDRAIANYIAASCALQRFANSGAFRRHLLALEPKLVAPGALKGWRIEARQFEDDSEGDIAETTYMYGYDGADYYDALPSETGPNQRMPIWKSYRNWLRVIISHTDAVERLAAQPFRSLKVTHLMVPAQSSASASWDEILEHPEFKGVRQQLSTFLCYAGCAQKYTDCAKEAYDALNLFEQVPIDEDHRKDSNTSIKKRKKTPGPADVPVLADILQKMVKFAEEQEHNPFASDKSEGSHSGVDQPSKDIEGNNSKGNHSEDNLSKGGKFASKYSEGGDEHEGGHSEPERPQGTCSGGKFFKPVANLHPGWSVGARHILSLLHSNSTQRLLTTLNQETLLDIEEVLDTMLKMGKFFTFISKEKPAPSVGTVHCEASLVSLWVRVGWDDKYDENSRLHNIHQLLQDYEPQFGVSNRCCPSCTYLIYLLTGKNPDFHVRGHHNSFYACSLPSWLPLPILQEMVSWVLSHLQRELMLLKGLSDTLNHCATTTGSEVLSVSSETKPVRLTTKVQARIYRVVEMTMPKK